MSGSLQKSFAGGSRPLGRKNYQEQRLRSSRLMILLLFHLPAKGCSKSRRCVKPGPWFTALQDIRRPNAVKPFQSSSSSVWWIVMTDNDPSINQITKPNQVNTEPALTCRPGPATAPWTRWRSGAGSAPTGAWGRTGGGQSDRGGRRRWSRGWARLEGKWKLKKINGLFFTKSSESHVLYTVYEFPRNSSREISSRHFLKVW